MKKAKVKPTRKYEKPKLVKIGRLTDLTQAKGGTKNDGAGKPSSRLNGGPS